MLEHVETTPYLKMPLGPGSGAIADAVADLIGPAGLADAYRGLTPESVEMFGLALIEILHSVDEYCGAGALADGAIAELWTGQHLAVLVLRFRGRPLPEWLVANWDRMQEPERLAPSGEAGWGWLLVREALDSVDHRMCADAQMLLLERRIW